MQGLRLGSSLAPRLAAPRRLQHRSRRAPKHFGVQLLLDHIPDGKGRQAIREHGSAQTKEKALKSGLDLGVPNYGGVPAAPEKSLEVDASGEVDLSGEPMLDALNEDEDKDIDN